MEAGALVPDEVIIDIVKERLDEPDCKNGYILDGMPRTIAQAEALEKAGITFDMVLYIKVSDEVIQERMAGRRTCSVMRSHIPCNGQPSEGRRRLRQMRRQTDHPEGRRPETVKNRLEVYHRETEPLLAFYKTRGTFKVIDTQPELAQTTACIFEALGIHDD
jgi:adenylate kinase